MAFVNHLRKSGFVKEVKYEIISNVRQEISVHPENYIQWQWLGESLNWLKHSVNISFEDLAQLETDKELCGTMMK